MDGHGERLIGRGRCVDFCLANCIRFGPSFSSSATLSSPPRPATTTIEPGARHDLAGPPGPGCGGPADFSKQHVRASSEKIGKYQPAGRRHGLALGLGLVPANWQQAYALLDRVPGATSFAGLLLASFSMFSSRRSNLNLASLTCFMRRHPSAKRSTPMGR